LPPSTFLQRGGEAAERLAEFAAEQLHHGFGKRDFDRRIEHRLAGEAAGDHHDGHVADHLGRRRDLDDIAEHLVDFGVGKRHFGPAMIVDAERARLFAQIRVLAARHAVHIDLGGARANVALERHIAAAHLFPIGRDQRSLSGSSSESRGPNAAPRRWSPDSAAR
jgi:hypothetical protein